MLTVVTGPPCAGKSSHVQANAGAGAIVIDLDAIARALGSTDPHEHGPAILRVARAARHAAITAAVREHGRGAEVWVVDSAPSPHRQRQYHQAAATYVHLNASAAELHRRATAQGRDTRAHRRIDQWRDTVEVVPTPASRPW